MTPQEQRVAIAEHCGWKVIQNGLGSTIIMREAAPDEWHIVDPLSDLNAMHEAEKMLTRAEWSIYTAMINSSMAAGNQGICQAICHATATQRADAFLRTVGKWKDKL